MDIHSDKEMFIFKIKIVFKYSYLELITQEKNVFPFPTNKYQAQSLALFLRLLKKTQRAIITESNL